MPPPREKKRVKLDDAPVVQKDDRPQKDGVTPERPISNSESSNTLDSESENFVHQLEENWEQFTKKYDDLFNGTKRTSYAVADTFFQLFLQSSRQYSKN
jgi:hypothetical protein